MSSKLLARGVAVVTVGAIAANASAIAIPDVPSTEPAEIGALVPLDLSSITDIAAATNFNGVNEISNPFSSSIPGAFTGTLTARVFGNNGGNLGPGLNDVLVIYDFVGDGPSGIDEFEFGVDSGRSMDISDLIAATQGTLTDLTSAGQVSPLVDVFSNVSNDTYLFDHAAAFDTLGSPGNTERVSWYVRTTGDIKINVVDVVVRNAGVATVQSLGLVDDPGQPDLNVPAPGPLSLMALGLGVAGTRRRRG